MDSLDLEMDNAEFNKNKTKYFMLRWFDEERIFNLLDAFIEEICEVYLPYSSSNQELKLPCPFFYQGALAITERSP